MAGEQDALCSGTSSQGRFTSFATPRSVINPVTTPFNTAVLGTKEAALFRGGHLTITFITNKNNHITMTSQPPATSTDRFCTLRKVLPEGPNAEAGTWRSSPGTT